MTKKISVLELEEKILEKEEVVVKIRAPAGAEVDDYTYDRKAAGTTTVTDWIEGRIRPLVGKYETVVINGGYTTPHGRTKLSTLRSSYER
ncbi:MAG: hypothetical protein ACYCTY_14470 [Sulfuricella sp.]